MDNPASGPLPSQAVDPELAQKMAEKSDAELTDMFATPENWTDDALQAAQLELQKRNVALPSSEEAPPPTLPESPAVRAGAMCAQHPNVPAIQQCRKCGEFMCATCDFVFPGNLHFCPKCISDGDDRLRGKRKKLMIWSFVLAAWSTVGMSCLVSGVLQGMAQTKADKTALGWVLLLFVLGPSITGLSLGASARRKPGPNPAALWIAIAWNAVLLTSFVLLMIVGLSRN